MNPRILVTLGPASLSEDIVSKISDLGVYVFRINLSHTPLEEVEKTIRKIQSWTDVPVCLDSEGAQLRNQYMDGGEVFFEEGDKVKIHFDAVKGNKENISFTPVGMAQEFSAGSRIRIDFDGAEFTIESTHQGYCLAVVTRAGNVGSNKAADIDQSLPFDSITPKDFSAIEIGLKNNIDHFALSFTNNHDNVVKMREACGESSNIICKIESRDGVRNLYSIMEKADAILIDRGDLSRQVELQKIPLFQRRIISSANESGKPVYVATNLLETMTANAAPTRAELNDVVSTLLMGANGLVLAAETAIGKHPYESVQMIRLLIDEVSSWDPNSTLSEMLD